MADDKSRAEDYRERVQLLRSAANRMCTAEGRRQLLRIADEFEQLADRLERERCG